MLLHKTFCKPVRDVKVIPSEAIAKQHHLLVCDFVPTSSPALRKSPSPEDLVPDLQSEYQGVFITETTWSNASGSGTKEIWRELKSSLLEADANVSESTKKHWGATRTGGAMRLLVMQLTKNGDAGKPGRKVAVRRNIRRPSDTPNKLAICKIPG